MRNECDLITRRYGQEIKNDEALTATPWRSFISGLGISMANIVHSVANI